LQAGLFWTRFESPLSASFKQQFTQCRAEWVLTVAFSNQSGRLDRTPAEVRIALNAKTIAEIFNQ
jgi:hypothetical protein